MRGSGLIELCSLLKNTAPSFSRGVFGHRTAATGGGRYVVQRAVGFLAFLAGCVPAARAEVTVQDPGTFVVDRAGIVDTGTEQMIETFLAELARKTTTQVKVLTVSTIEDEDFFSFVQRHVERVRLAFLLRVTS